MTQDLKDKNFIEHAIRSCYSSWSESYYQDYYKSESAYPAVHVKIVHDELKKADAHNVIDAGCGPASVLRELKGLDIERYGFDLTPEMVKEARRVLSIQGLSENRIWEGNVLDIEAYRCAVNGTYDAAICFGVLPHIPENKDKTVLNHLAASVRPGGRVLVEARNQLFALFTLNRYSRDFFCNVLINEQSLRKAGGIYAQEALDTVFAEIDQRFRLDLPPIRKGKTGEPGYDEILSRTHNPFELTALATEAGFADVEVLFYHYHCLPPMVEPLLPELFRKQSIAIENTRDWRGYFMASAFVLSCCKAGLS